MRRVVSLYLPTWPTDRIRRRKGAPPSDEPLVTVKTEGSRRLVAAVDEAAAKLGLRSGQTITHAQALVPNLHVVDATPEEDEASLTELARWCIGYSPIVAPNPPDGVWIDIAGADHLFGGEEELLTNLVKRLRRQEIQADACMADAPGTAWAVVRYGKAVVISPGRSVEAVASLPVPALRLPLATVEALYRLGIERIGQLAAMPRAPMVRRFGKDVALRLDQAFGHVFEPLNPLVPKETPARRVTFVEPIGRIEDLQSVVRRLADRLCRDLECGSLGVRRLDLVFERIDRRSSALRIGTAKATREADHLAKLFDERLQTVDPGFGIEAAMLIASKVEPLSERQVEANGLQEGDAAHVDLSRLVDRLGARLGPKRVYRLVPVESRVPERVMKRVPALAPATGVIWPENLPRPEWDKNDIEILKFMKVDVLGLGMLGCMRRSFELLREHKGVSHDLASIPTGDQETYDMICRADTIGVFQIESRAQMAMLPRLKPKTFYDLVIEVAIVRPGPIQGDMVHPFIRRREGREEVSYPTPELKNVLGKTLGVPLFQEQAMRVAIECAGFTPSEADQLRRSMATFKAHGDVSKFQTKLIQGMLARDYTQEFAERIFKQLEGFGSYSFPESHAASFALIAYASSWMKCHHPDVFCCALLNSQPMGFYAPAQIVRDAKQHGIDVLPVDVNHSRWDCTLEPTDRENCFAVRLGLRMAKGLANDDAASVVIARSSALFGSIEDIWLRAKVKVAALERLAEADAFGSLGINRRDALWTIKGLSDTQLPLFAAADERDEQFRAEGFEPDVSLTPMTAGREVVEDYRSKGLTLRHHPVAFLREELERRRMIRCADLKNIRDGRRVSLAGFVLVRQRPGSAQGVTFMTIEDETDVANLVIWPSLFEQQRRLILSSGMIGCRGRVQKEGDVIHVVAEHMLDLSDLLRSVGDREEPFPLLYGRGDEAKHGSRPDPRKAPMQEHKPRDVSLSDRRAGDGIKIKTRDFR